MKPRPAIVAAGGLIVASALAAAPMSARPPADARAEAAQTAAGAPPVHARPGRASRLLTRTVPSARPVRPQTRTAPTPSPVSARARRRDRVLVFSWAAAQAWASTPKARAVVRCESGGRPNAVSPTGKYRGLWQVDASFWHSYHGDRYAARADLATVAEQNATAYRGYLARGWTPWACA